MAPHPTEPDDESLVGRALGHYRILAWIGGGGMGEVYLAEDTRLRRRVAVKLLPPAMAQSPDRLLRFENEAKLVAALNHPSIVTLFSIEEAEGHRFLTMEYVDGKTLAEVMPKDGLPLPEFFRLAIPMAEALVAAHEKKIIHRDLKPSNIMVTREGRVKILDFGVGKLRAQDDRTVFDGPFEPSLTREGVILGTPRYMSPEQVQGKPLDGRSDLFSLGIIFYEMLTGKRPFPGENSAQIISALLRDGPAPLSDLREGAPLPLEPLLERCLAKEPEMRFANAGELLDALRQVKAELDSGSAVLTGTAPTRLKPQAGPAGLRRWLVPALVGLGLLGGLGAWVVGSGGATPGKARLGSANGAPAKPAVAVLPLGNFTNEPEYFVDGITDSLISSLARVSALRVISRQSVMRYRDSKLSLPDIAQELGVDFVVLGSAARTGEVIRLTIELIQPDPEEHVWTESYERSFAEVLSLQSEVAQRIASKVRVQLTQDEQRRLPTNRKVDPQGYEEYLRGRFYWNQRSEEGLRRAITHFRAALDRDPTYAPAYSGLADSYALLGYLFSSPEENYPLARAAARQALEIDADLAEAHASMGVVQLLGDWDWVSSERSFKRAIELNPSYATAHHWYWTHLVTAGRFDDADREIREALKLDPLSPTISVNVGMQLYLARRFEEATAQLRKTLEMHPQFASTHLYLGWVQESQGKRREAVESFARYFDGFGHPDVALAARTGLKGGDAAAAYGKMADVLVAKAEQGTIKPETVAWFLNPAGRPKEALDWLEKAMEKRSPMVIFAPVAEAWDRSHGDPRFQTILRKVGIPTARQP
jgi:eukaryotic-like serine/threonine-protein kinase